MTAVSAVTAPFLAETVVLGGAGLAKIWRPEYTARALRVAGLPAGRTAVRAGALAEVVVAVAALAAPGRFTGALVGASYAAFAAFVIVALRRGWPLSSCGCFGRPDSAPGYQHAGLDVGACVIAAWWAAGAPSRAGPSFFHDPGLGLAVGVIAAVIAGLAYLVWTNPLTGSSA